MREKLTAYERHESIKSFLLRERKTPAAYLADMFNVSRQTIVNDMVFLSCRLPITTKTGGGGGIFLEMDFETPKEYLNAEEENLLIMLSETLTKKDKLIIHNILNKFFVHKG